MDTSRNGQRWVGSEIRDLLREVSNHTPIAAIACQHRRSENAIRFRIVQEMTRANRPLEKIAEAAQTTVDEVRTIQSKRQMQMEPQVMGVQLCCTHLNRNENDLPAVSWSFKHLC